MFNVYPFDHRRQVDRGTKKAYQRWESCLKDFQYSLRPALELLYSQRYHDEATKTGVRNLAQEAVDTCIKIISQGDKLHLEVIIDLIAKLSKVKIVIGFTESIITLEELEEYYSELLLRGDEGYVELWHGVLRHQQKIDIEPSVSWRKKIDQFAKSAYITFDSNTNVLCKFVFDVCIIVKP